MSSISLGYGGSFPDLPAPEADKVFHGLAGYELPRIVGPDDHAPFLRLLDQVATFSSINSRSKKREFLEKLTPELSERHANAVTFETGRELLAAVHHILPDLSSAGVSNLCFMIVHAPADGAVGLHTLAERILTDSDATKLIRSTVQTIGMLRTVTESLPPVQRESFIISTFPSLCHSQSLDVIMALVSHLGASVLQPENRETLAWAANIQSPKAFGPSITVQAITRITKSISECITREELGDPVHALDVERALIRAIEKQPQKLHSLSEVFANFSREIQITNKYLLTVAEAMNTGWSVESLQKSLHFFQQTGRPLGQCEGLLDQKSLHLLKSISHAFAATPEGVSADWAITILRGQEVLERLCSGNPGKYKTYRSLYFSLLEKAADQSMLSESYERDIILLAEAGAFEKSNGKSAKIESLWRMQRLMENLQQEGTPPVTAARIAKLSIFDGFDQLRQTKSALFSELLLCCENPEYAENWSLLRERLSSWSGLDPNAPESLLRRAYILGLQHHLASETGHSSDDILRYLSKTPITAITELLKSREIRSKAEICDFLASIGSLDVPDWRKREAMIGQYIGRPGNEANFELNISYRADSLPYRRSDPRAAQTTGEIVEIFERSKEIITGFGAQTAEARRPLLYIPSLHHQFAKDCTLSSGAFIPASPHHMPGPGTIFSGINLNRLLVSDAQNIEQPFLEYKLAWPWLAQAIDELPYSKVLYLRGLIGVIPPDAESYRINDTHYSLIAYNDHFHNFGGWATYLIPTEILSKFLRGKIQPISTDLNSKIEKDTEEIRLFLPELMAEAAKIGKPILNLRWFSNFAGLGNAFPPGSAPYHLWENDIKYGTRDRAGHVHKFYYPGFRRGSVENLAPLQKAHTQVYNLAAGCFNIHDAFRMTRAIWHKDWDSLDENLTFDIGEDQSDNPLPSTPRMLRQGLEFYRAR